MKLILLAASILTVNSLTVHEQWLSFKEKHGKSYKNIAEEKHRFETFENNLKTITEHNAKYAKGESSYYLGINKYADLTTGEFSKILLGSRPYTSIELPVIDVPKDDDLPETYDARTIGAVLPVRDQGYCASGYAFATTGAVEGMNFMINGVSIPLSPQELVDCSSDYGNNGCLGGFIYTSYDYMSYKGIHAESSYSYVEDKNDQCLANKSEPTYSVNGHGRVAQFEGALQYLIKNKCPTAVYIYGNPLHLYGGGIYDNEERCPNDWDLLNHNVLAVGWDNENGTDYWILKNSWGTDWGEEGYLRLKKKYNYMRNSSGPYISRSSSFTMI